MSQNDHLGVATGFQNITDIIFEAYRLKSTAPNFVIPHRSALHFVRNLDTGAGLLEMTIADEVTIIKRTDKVMPHFRIKFASNFNFALHLISYSFTYGIAHINQF